MKIWTIILGLLLFLMHTACKTVSSSSKNVSEDQLNSLRLCIKRTLTDAYAPKVLDPDAIENFSDEMIKNAPLKITGDDEYDFGEYLNQMGCSPTNPDRVVQGSMIVSEWEVSPFNPEVSNLTKSSK